MSVIVQHDKRKIEILQKSLDVFMEEGYKDATFQKIADRCGITRTTLYVYFNSRDEIFFGSIKEFFIELEKNIREIILKTKVSAGERLRSILMKICETCEENKKLITVTFNYFMELRKTNIYTNRVIKYHVLKIRHFINEVIIEGIQNGEFSSVSVKKINRLLYSLLESSIFRLAILNQDSTYEIRKALNTAVDLIIEG